MSKIVVGEVASFGSGTGCREAGARHLCINDCVYRKTPKITPSAFAESSGPVLGTVSRWLQHPCNQDETVA